jgi:ABC-type branched-subunit amino acid transport system ATPase component
MLTGIAGGLFAVLNSYISPESFPFFQSITFLLIVMIGGAGTVAGPVLGALVAVLVPELLSSLAQYRVLVMGGLFLVVLRLAPGGMAALLQVFSTKPEKLAWKVKEISDAAVLPERAVTAALSVENLDVRFGGVHAVKSLSFEALPHQITSIVGPNGAGKSTAVNLICGFYQPTGGSVRLGATLLTGLSPNRIAESGIVRTFQTTQLFAHLTVLDNILIGMRGGRLSIAALIAAEQTAPNTQAALSFLSLVGFEGDPYQAAGALAHGERRLVEIARALAAKPAVLLLDEPAAGLDAADTEKLAALLKAIAASGIAVILIEHDMDLVMSISDRVIVLDAGQKIAEGPPSDVMANAEVRKAYLGKGAAPQRAHAPRTPSSRPQLLAAKGISSGYGEIPVLRDVTVAVKEGETIAILGPNGAGKTTLLRTLAGLNRCSSGMIEFAGRRAEKLPAEERARLGLVLVPEGRQVFPDLNVFENLMLGGINLGRAEAEARAEQLLARFPRLVERRHQRAGLLSGGEQQMLAIARGLIAKPKILMLDEPSLGLAPLVVDEVYAWLAALKEEGLTILLADQLAPLALSVADRAYVLQRGSIQFEGEAAKLAADPALLRAYLGESVAA